MMKTNKYIINGLFLTQTLSGVHRYAIEIVKELDNIYKGDIRIAIPEKIDIINTIKLHNIKIIRYGKRKDRAWENIDFYYLLTKEKAIGINLCNTAPLRKVDIIVIHDVGYKNCKEIKELGGNKLKLLFRDFQNKIYCNNAKKVITVSEFSKTEIKKFYKTSVSDIIVIPNAWQHYETFHETDFNPKNSIIKTGQYYFALSNLSDHKNFKWILEEATVNPEEIFVIAGGSNPRYFKFSSSFDSLKNVIYLGRISDNVAKTYMAHCKAFISPSLYEGFGIPPLEAMSTGANVIVSDIPAHREVFDGAAVYINPRRTDYILNELKFENLKNKEEILRKYSWRKSAIQLMEELYPSV